LDIDYSGGIQILLSTKLNLMKLKSANLTSANTPAPSTATTATTSFSFKNNESSAEESSLKLIQSSPIDISQPVTDSSEVGAALGTATETVKPPKQRRTAITNSDEEDSAESSGDEYVHTGDSNSEELVETTATSKKLLNFVSKIAASNYFQKATENKYIKMAMENVSNCQLTLNVEVRKIAGTIALNIPPHPSDRIW
jgi:hypothetical protein